jgi:hypothetical protein
MRVNARELGLLFPASTLLESLDSPLGVEAELSSQQPEFASKGFDCRFDVPSRQLPSWDPEWTPFPQLSANADEAEVALAGSLTVAGSETWAPPGTILHLQLPVREIPVEAHVEARRPARSTTRTAAKSDLRWVAHAIPWAPMP